MSLYRNLELLTYAIINYLPYTLLALHPVKNRLKWTKKTIVVFLCFFTVLEYVRIAFISHGLHYVSVILSINIILQFIFYAYVSNQHIGRSAFIFLALYTISSSLSCLAKYCEFSLFPLRAVEKYTWSHTLCILALQIIILVPISIYIIKYTYLVFKNDNNSHWRFLWVVPSVFYVLWYFCVFLNTEAPVPEQLFSGTPVIIQITVLIGALVSYYTIICLVREHMTNYDLIKQNSEQNLQLAHYSNIQEKIEEIRRVRHDIRHHANLIYSYAQDNNTDAIKEYISTYKKLHLDDVVITFCDNYTANILFQHFHSQAKTYGINYSVRAYLPNDLPFEKEELTDLFGNLLENALDASKKEYDAIISVNTKFEKGFLFFHICNTFTRELIMTETGDYLSSKDSVNPHGIGLSSVHNIIKTRNGIIDISHQNDLFSCCVQIPLVE